MIYVGMLANYIATCKENLHGSNDYYSGSFQDFSDVTCYFLNQDKEGINQESTGSTIGWQCEPFSM